MNINFILKYSAVSVVAVLSEQKKTCFLLPWEVDISAQKMARLLGLLLLQGYLQEWVMDLDGVIMPTQNHLSWIISLMNYLYYMNGLAINFNTELC